MVNFITMRDLLVKNLHDKFLGTATVIRDSEFFPITSPQIDISFRGQEKAEYQFLGDVLGNHATAPYKKYAKVFSEIVIIRMIVKEPDAGPAIARSTLGTIASDLEETILKEWPAILSEYNSALNRSSCFARRDVSFLVNASQRFLALEMRFKLNESVIWDLVPEEDLAPEAETVEVIIKQV